MKPLIDLHTHTVASTHAYSTLTENISHAQNVGLKILGLSDHAPALPSTTCPAYFANLKILPTEFGDLKLLRGVELNILNSKGEVDLPKEITDGLDYAIASIHLPCFIQENLEGNTAALIHAMDHDKVIMIGHPDDDRFPVNYEKLVLAAKSKNVLLEVNNSSLGPNSFRVGARENVIKMLGLCKEHGLAIMMSSDAHFHSEVGNFDRVLEVLREVDFPMDLVMNYNVEAFLKRL